MVSYQYSNTAQPTTLSGSIAAGSTSISVGSTAGFPTAYPYILALDFEAAAEELVSVTNASGTTLTVTRAFGGTSAQSHSLGAAVRHVVNAQDLADFRTHEAATGAVHGLTGDIVGTSDTQTLSNKTLTSPTVNSGALAGTLTGAPTLSGAVVLSGTPSISTGAALAGTFTGTPTFSGAVTLSGGGALSGTFTGAPTLSGAAIFTGTPEFRGALAATVAAAARVTGDASQRFQIRADGTLQWGSGASGADVVLHRPSANLLKLNDSFEATGNLAIGGTAAVTGTLSASAEEDVDGFTPISGFTLNESLCKKTCGVCTAMVYLAVTSTISTTSSTTTNIVDTEAGVIPSGFRPPTIVSAIWSNGLTAGEGTIDTNGVVTLRTTGYSQAIASGSNVRLTSTYVL